MPNSLVAVCCTVWSFPSNVTLANSIFGNTFENVNSPPATVTSASVCPSRISSADTPIADIPTVPTTIPAAIILTNFIFYSFFRFLFFINKLALTIKILPQTNVKHLSSPVCGSEFFCEPNF